MAQVLDLMQTYDMDTVNDQFVADGVHTISPTDTPLQIMFPKMQIANEKAEWIEQSLTAKTTTLAATATATATELTVASGAASDLFPGDTTYKVQIRIDNEVFLATANATASKLTVTPHFGGTTAASHASGAVVHIISEGDIEGADAKKAASPPRTRPSNFVQTFSKVIENSRMQERIKTLGGITSESDHDEFIAMKQIALDLESQILHGVLSDTGSGAGDATNPRFMKGIFGFLLAAAVTDSGSVDTTAIEADITAIWDAGGVPRAIVCNGTMANDVANLYSDRIRTDVQTQVGGVNITSIINPLGEGPIAIIPHRLMTAGQYFMLDTSRIALGFVDPFFEEEVESEADSAKTRIQGDYTLLMMNTTAHRFRHGFS